MMKKFLASSAAVAFVISACTTENTVAPNSEQATDSSSSIQELSSGTDFQTTSSSSIKAPDILSSSSVNDILSFAENKCSVTKVSDNVVVLDMTVANSENTKMTMTLVGTDVEIEGITTYDISTPISEIDQMCKESKESAAESNATVVCEGRTITVKYKDSANGKSVNDVVESAQRICDFMDIFENLSSSSISETPLSSSSIYTFKGGKQKPNDAECLVTVDVDTAFAMAAVKPDSITQSISSIYSNGVLEATQAMLFADAVPESIITETCEKLKTEAIEENIGEVVTCNGRIITETVSIRLAENPVPLAAANLTYICDQIEETGIFMDDVE